MGWVDDAACKGFDTDGFYPEARNQTLTTALSSTARVCYECPVKLHCRIAGLGEPYGIFGNSTPRERSDMRVRMGLTTPASTALQETGSLAAIRYATVRLMDRAHRLGVDPVGVMKTAGYKHAEDLYADTPMDSFAARKLYGAA